jgi:tetratricopeptide (TPR) repeat protein
LKPLGTIIACFRHVDEETRSILQAVMDESKDYNDFAEQLCERVIKETSPPLLNYFAYFHAYNQLKFNLIRTLEKKVKVPDLAKPLLLLTQPWGNIDWDDHQKSISAALKDAPNDWIACHIYMIWRFDIGSTLTYPERLTDLEPLRIIESKIRYDQDFSFFLAFLHHIKALEFQREDKIDESKTWYDRAITIANQHDDLAHVAILLYNKASMVKNANFNESLSILKSQRSVSERLGYIYALALNDLTMGLIAQARGEYETTVKHLKEHVQSLDTLGLDSWVNFHRLVIASQYNQMQNGAQALEIVNNVLEGYQSQKPWFPYIHKTWALLNLDRINEATQTLDLARDWAPKSGVDMNLGYIRFLEGLMFVKRTEFPSAKFELEQAHSLFRSFPSTNQTLIHLTYVEIEMFSYGKENTHTDVSGPWMQRLMEQVQEKDIPGIEAQAMLLKAKFRFKQGRTTEAKKLVKKVLKTSEKSDMKYLEKMAESLLPELLVS